MSDLADGLEDLRGATPVRERLLVAARASLERLAAEAQRFGRSRGDGAAPARPDPALRRELAEAHDRVGDIEAGLYLPRTGTTAQGAAHFAEARTIREALLAQSPGDPLNQLAMAESLRRAADAVLRSGQAPESIATYDQAVGLVDSALLILPVADAARARESRIEALADAAWARVQAADAARDAERAPALIAQALALYGQIESYWRDRFRADVGDRLATRRLGRVTDQRARAHITLGRALFAAAADAAKAGRVDEATRQAQAAEAALREAVRLGELAALDFERLHARHPQSGILRREQMLAIYNTGDALMRMGDAAALDQPAVPRPADAPPASEHYRAALAKFTAALALAEELVAADASNLSARRELALVLNKLGNTQRDLSRLNLALRAEALATFERSLAIRQDLFATDPTEQHRRDLAVAHFKLGEMEKLGAEAATGAARSEALARARLQYTRSREAFQALVAAGIAVRESELARVNQDLADIEEALRKHP
jgi:hypothetical protein